INEVLFRLLSKLLSANSIIFLKELKATFLTKMRVLLLVFCELAQLKTFTFFHNELSEIIITFFCKNY
ncbi:MAG: hypothetical protein ACRDEA_11445, partial [Microcystaceae cyanobacterium]